MPIRWRSKIILLKPEGTYGVDAVPTGVNGMLMTKVSFQPMEGDDISRDLEYPWLGGQTSVPTGLYGRLKGAIELVPSGTKGVAPAWGPVARVLGLAEVIVLATSVTYNPISDNMESGTLYFWVGGTRYIFLGSRGTGVLRWNAQGLPMMEVTIDGLFTQPTEAARVTPDLTGFQAPPVLSKATVPAFTINGVSLVMRSFSLDLGNQVERRLLIPTEQIFIPDRTERITVQVEAVPLTTFNPYALAEAQTQVAVTLTQGTVSGSILTLNVSKAQVQRPSGFENQQGILEWILSLTPIPQAGNDQFTIALT